MIAGSNPYRHLKTPVFILLAFSSMTSVRQGFADTNRTILIPANHVHLTSDATVSTKILVYSLPASQTIEPVLIPAQVDERDGNGDFVLENGIPFTAHGGDGIFNGTDELSVLLPVGRDKKDRDKKQRDKKQRVNSNPVWNSDTGRWIAKKHGDRSKAWRVQLKCDPDRLEKNDALGPVPIQDLLVVAPGTNATHVNRMTAAPVAYDPVAKSITTEKYQYSFNQENPGSIGVLKFFHDETGNGSNSETAKQANALTVVSGGDFGFWLTPPWRFPVVARSGRDAAGAIESWRSGPVRTIVAVGNRYSAFWSLVEAHLFSELVFYPDRLQIPSVVDIPFSPKNLLGSGSGFAYGLQLATEVSEVSQYRTVDGAYLQASSQTVRSTLRLRARVDSRLAAGGALPRLWNRRPSPDSGSEVRKNARNDVPARARDWLQSIGATTGFFVDISQIDRGRYDFSLDLESHVEANDTHTEFLTCKSVWTAVESLQTDRPAKQHEASKHFLYPGRSTLPRNPGGQDR